LFKRPRDNLNIRPDAARPAELPQLLGGPVVLMNRLVDGVGVDLTSAIPIQLFGDMLDEVGQSRLVVGSYDGARSLSLCLAAHGGHVTLANGLGFGA
jgi:hypothetical protein